MHTLVQKHFFLGTQKFELHDEIIKASIKSPFKGKKELEIVLAMLNPEPVIDRPYLHFHSRVKCGPLMSLFLNNPNPEEFNAFVDAVKIRALHEYEAFSGISSQPPTSTV